MPTWSESGRVQEEVVDNTNSFITSATGASASGAVVASIPALANYTAVLTGVTVTAIHASATVESLFKITGLSTANGGTGELDYQFVQSSTLGGLLDLDFSNPVPAGAVGSAINFNVAQIAGGGNVSIAVQGFYRK